MRSLVLSSLLALTLASPRVPTILRDADAMVAPKLNKFKYVGVNEAGPEFGEKIFPGKKGKEYTWLNNTSVQVFIDKGVNLFRINFLMERLIQNKMTGTLDKEYFADLKNNVDYITSKGSYAMLNPHNYGRYYEKVIQNPEDMKAWWTTVAKEFKDNPKVIWDTNNEFHTMDQSLVVKLNQAAIDGIRSTGAKQEINVEGNAWTGAWTWVSKSQNGATMGALKDPENKLVYQMHQYLDTDGSGTHEQCVSATIGEERLKEATEWLRKNKKVGFLGEFAAGNNEQCKKAVTGMLKYMQANADVWQGWAWWSAGPWWGPYIYGMEPPSGKAYVSYFDLIMKYT